MVKKKKKKNLRFFTYFQQIYLVRKLHASGHSGNGKTKLFYIFNMFSTQLDENIYQRNGKNYVILHIFSRSINSHKITRQWAFRKRENYVILHTFNRPTIHNNMKMYIQETVKTTSFYTFSVDLYSHKITRQWASRKRKNCVILHTFNRPTTQ